MTVPGVHTRVLSRWLGSEEAAEFVVDGTVREERGPKVEASTAQWVEQRPACFSQEHFERRVVSRCGRGQA